MLQSDLYSVIQLPYNIVNTKFSTIIDQATKLGKIVVINRPFNMGGMLYDKTQGDVNDKVKAFEFILEKQFNGFILTGTKSQEHLKENYNSFIQAHLSSY